MNGVGCPKAAPQSVFSDWPSSAEGILTVLFALAHGLVGHPLTCQNMVAIVIARAFTPSDCRSPTSSVQVHIRRSNFAPRPPCRPLSDRLAQTPTTLEPPRLLNKFGDLQSCRAAPMYICFQINMYTYIYIYIHTRSNLFTGVSCNDTHKDTLMLLGGVVAGNIGWSWLMVADGS